MCVYIGVYVCISIQQEEGSQTGTVISAILSRAFFASCSQARKREISAGATSGAEPTYADHSKLKKNGWEVWLEDWLIFV